MLENSETIVQGNRLEVEAATEKDGLLIAKQTREVERLMTENEVLKSNVKEHAKLQKEHRKLKHKYLDSDDFADYLIDQLENVKELAEVKDKLAESHAGQAKVKPEEAKAQTEADPQMCKVVEERLKRIVLVRRQRGRLRLKGGDGITPAALRHAKADS